MFKNYFKIALRNLWKHKGFSAINVVGLSMGLACFLMITMYVLDEVSYDRFNQKSERIFRINSDIRFGGTDMNMAVTADPMGETLKRDYPQVEQYTRLYASSGSKMVKNGEKFVTENRVAHVDSTFFDVFTFPAISGDTKTALNEPNTVVITKTTAERYFGSSKEALGKMIETDDNDKTLYKVSAVIEDMPKNSHFSYDFLFSMDNVSYDFGNYLSHNFHTYIVLRDGVDYREFNKKFDEVIEKYIFPQAKQFLNMESIDDFEKSGNKIGYSLIPLTDIHLKSGRTPELGANGNIQYVYIFSVAAIFILLIACINFMNLSTARSAGRAKEVGIRKVMGTDKKSLIWQFLTESIVMALIALIISVFFVWLLIPWFNGIAGKELSMSVFLSPLYIILIVSLPFIVGAMAGIYPAFYLSSFKPIAVLKGKVNAGSKKDYFRSSLVIFQFTTSIILIIGTIVIYKQLDHIQNSKIGFDKEQVMVVENMGLSSSARKSVKNEISSLSGIKSASFAGYLPVSNSSRNDNTFSLASVMDESNSFNMQNWNVDYDYLKTMDMELLEGRFFSDEFGSDSTAIVINEATAKLAGFTEPLGKKLYTNGKNNEILTYTVIGVVKNFNFESLRQNVGALSFRLGNNSWKAAYRLNPGKISSTIAAIEAKYKAAAPNMPLNYEFLDESFENMYKQERRVGEVALTFSVLAVLIACLGLFGLATYIAEQRKKEIGIRKVLGASIPNIVAMMSIDFVKLVLIAFAIAAPFAWWAMDGWLQDFAFRINLSWWIFALTGLTAIAIAVATLSFQAIKAALANPVKSLRSE
ncbi:putative ABC transport system permease protein [Flavobacteriaceae bacterium MAR_2010_188]|nr:putative ABC transport system permease protein [Flavobacteriaceae bacterium MAR_2010_188]